MTTDDDLVFQIRNHLEIIRKFKRFQFLATFFWHPESDIEISDLRIANYNGLLFQNNKESSYESPLNYQALGINPVSSCV